MRVGPSLVLLISLCGVALLSAPPSRRGRGPHQPPLLPRPEFMEVVGAPVRSMVADYFWIQTVHATGVARTAEEYRDIYDYALQVITLDPAFEYVYVFAGGAIPANLGREQWVNTEEATDILRRGVSRFPNNVMLGIMLSYNLSYFHRKPGEAAELLEKTARLPGAPRYLSALATRLYAESGDIESGLALAETLLSTSDDPETRESFRIRRLELQLERILRKVDVAAASFKERTGHNPKGVDELIAAGDLDRLPEDPLGGQISVDSEGKGFSTAQGRRLRTFGPGDRG